MVKKFGKNSPFLNLPFTIIFTDRGRRTALIDGRLDENVTFLNFHPLDMEIELNCPQFATKSFKILNMDNPIRRICIRILLSP